MNRELDAEICEKVFGWTSVSTGLDYEGKNDSMILAPNGIIPEDVRLPVLGAIHKAYLCPPYSSRLDIVMDLCKHVGLVTPVSELPSEPEAIAKMCLEHYLNK